MGGGGKVKVIKGVNEEDTSVQTHKTCTAGERGSSPRGPMEEHQLLADAATLLIQGCTKTWGRQPFSPVSSHSTGSRWWEPGKASAVPAHMGPRSRLGRRQRPAGRPAGKGTAMGNASPQEGGVQPGDRGHQGAWRSKNGKNARTGATIARAPPPDDESTGGAAPHRRGLGPKISRMWTVLGMGPGLLGGMA